MNRRKFISQSITGSFLLANSSFPLSAFSDDPDIVKLTILHTNDVHSRIDPFPMDGGRNQGLGGAERRAIMINNIRSAEDHVLLFDCGDIFQGTPYFNMFGGELELKLMSKMKYDAATMGNHDFDAGVEGFDKQLKHANFPFVVSNYNFDDSLLNGKINDHLIMDKAGIRIGIVGTGIKLRGLVPENLSKGVQYLDPIDAAQKKAEFLKKEKNCDFIVCLSHLGYAYRDSRVSDIHLAQNTSDIDLILGGHTHTFMRKADIRRNMKGEEVIISQAGWGGILLGRLDIYFEKNKKRRCVSCKNSLIS